MYRMIGRRLRFACITCASLPLSIPNWNLSPYREEEVGNLSLIRSRYESRTLQGRVVIEIAPENRARS